MLVFSTEWRCIFIYKFQRHNTHNDHGATNYLKKPGIFEPHSYIVGVHITI